jgi:beta-RFAP synthase
MALAVARSLAEVYGLDSDPPALAQAVGRARRSAIGTWVFSGGGLVVEGGRHTGFDNCGPLIARVPFPPDWRCVVAVPGGKGLSGVREEEAFYRLPMPPREEVERVAHLVLLLLLPSIVEADLSNFGRALSHIQEITGRWFAAVQGSTFAMGVSEELVHRMREWRALGVGQSSWGPAVYGIVGRDDDAQRLADRARDFIGPEGVVYAGPFRSEGARVWTADADLSASSREH